MTFTTTEPAVPGGADVSAPSIMRPLGLGAPDPEGFGNEITYNGIPLVLSRTV